MQSEFCEFYMALNVGRRSIKNHFLWPVAFIFLRPSLVPLLLGFFLISLCLLLSSVSKILPFLLPVACCLWPIPYFSPSVHVLLPALTET